MNEPDSLNLVGPADLMVSDDGLHLLSLPPGKTIQEEVHVIQRILELVIDNRVGENFRKNAVRKLKSLSALRQSQHCYGCKLDSREKYFGKLHFEW